MLIMYEPFKFPHKANETLEMKADLDKRSFINMQQYPITDEFDTGFVIQYSR